MYDVRYEYIPANEQVKKYVVGKLEEICMLLSEIQYRQYLRQHPRDRVARFKSEVLSLYGYLAPKIDAWLRENQNKVNEEQQIDYNNIQVVQASGEHFVAHAKLFRTRDAVDMFLWLNRFCEMYGLTATKEQSKTVI